MSLPLCYLKNIHLTFGYEPLFTDISTQIVAGDRICLVGKNGSGKSTLLKVMAKDIEPDKGELYYAPGVRLGYLTQKPIVEEDLSIYDYVLQNVNVSSDETLAQKSYLADIILEKLKLNGEQKLVKLSGGKLRRADLAKVLIAEPDLLFLDEPTNHLDIDSIRWLEEYLKSYNAGMVIVSHDRAFLKNVSNKTIWLDRGKLLNNNKGYIDFERWSEEVFVQEERDLSKLGKELAKEHLWLQQGVSARRKRNQQRLHNLYSLRDKLKGDKSRFNNQSSNYNIQSTNSDNKAKLIIEMENVSFSYTDVEPPQLMLKPFSLKVAKGEIIGVIGPNGAGKTTLVKLLNGQFKPSSGSIIFGHNLQYSYLDQTRSELDPEATLWETLCPNGGDTVFIDNKPKHVVAYLKDFLFDSKQANSKVSTLSGGQQNRLLLAKLLMNPGNFLILDEPTNDLDMDTIDILIEILSEYKGSLVIVSHDRDFLEKLVTRTIIIEDHQVIDFMGGYYEYKPTAAGVVSNKASVPAKNEAKKERAVTRLSYKDERELSLLPEEIDNISKLISKFELELNEPDLYAKNPEAFNKLTQQISINRAELEKLENRWLELEEMKSNLVN
ncbi:MAG: ABC-F family ATP-binding cassette domain-containing protein [Rickettsiales bacterium]